MSASIVIYLFGFQAVMGGTCSSGLVFSHRRSNFSPWVSGASQTGLIKLLSCSERHGDLPVNPGLTIKERISREQRKTKQVSPERPPAMSGSHGRTEKEKEKKKPLALPRVHSFRRSSRRLFMRGSALMGMSSFLARGC